MGERRDIIFKRNRIVTNIGRVAGRGLMDEVCFRIRRRKLLKLMELLKMLKSTWIKAVPMIQ
jgi:hypothetical protein